MKAARRNVTAQAHSLRGPAGPGAHGVRPEPRQRVEVCNGCGEESAACECEWGQRIQTHTAEVCAWIAPC